MPFTTGVITNTRDFGTAATNIVLNTRNLNLTSSATITVQIFGSTNSSSFTPLYQAGFVVAPNSIDIRQFLIAGNVAYEVQINVNAVTNSQVVMSTFGIDQFGNLAPSTRVLQSELTSIPALTPLS
ncbi:hypothetical protein GFV16_05335 [Bacillus megaterium]|uniref:hypothetical protein n=1 Tax=Priestia megaterium TaxID=1404 RepID=UPI001294001E|nr:hypothetical protein [Priestia megaterium]MQR85368.1 hypothetical protein [Priestia megaterium]